MGFARPLASNPTRQPTARSASDKLFHSAFNREAREGPDAPAVQALPLARACQASADMGALGTLLMAAVSLLVMLVSRWAFEWAVRAIQRDDATN
jgi:hypothetical protein